MKSIVIRRAVACAAALAGLGAGLPAQGQNPAAEFAKDALLAGMGFVADYGNDKCTTVTEAVSAQAKSAATGAVLGGAAVGAATAAMTGDAGKAGVGTVIGATIGATLFPPLVKGNPTATQIYSGRDLPRQRDFELCELAHQAKAQAAPAWENFAALADTRACIIDRDPTRVSDAELQNCVKHDPELVTQLRGFVRTAFNINMAACEAGQQIWIKYDRLMVQNLKPGQSFIKSLPVPCSGRNPVLPRPYAWAQP
jgi:hypothetical protein